MYDLLAAGPSGLATLEGWFYGKVEKGDPATEKMIMLALIPFIFIGIALSKGFAEFIGGAMAFLVIISIPVAIIFLPISILSSKNKKNIVLVYPEHVDIFSIEKFNDMFICQGCVSLKYTDIKSPATFLHDLDGQRIYLKLVSHTLNITQELSLWNGRPVYGDIPNEIKDRYIYYFGIAKNLIEAKINGRPLPVWRESA